MTAHYVLSTLFMTVAHPSPDKHAPCTRMAVLHRLEEDNVIMYRDGAIHRI